MIRLKSALVVQNGLVEPSAEAHPPEGIYIARTLARKRWRVSVRVLNASCRDTLRKEYPPAHCEPVTLVTSPDVEQPQVSDTTPKLQEANAAARPNPSDAESCELYEFLTEYGDVFAMNGDDEGPPYRYGGGPTDMANPRGSSL
jgi:hypothetical protein